jgi:hypothetical protein
MPRNKPPKQRLIYSMPFQNLLLVVCDSMPRHIVQALPSRDAEVHSVNYRWQLRATEPQFFIIISEIVHRAAA